MQSDATTLTRPAISRRTVLKAAALVPGALWISGMWGSASARRGAGHRIVETSKSLTAWVRIAPDNTITLIASQSEMGQGITTTLAAALAHELDVPLESVAIEFALFDPAYRDPVYNWMFTGNSEGISSFYEMMRKMGATAREMLVTAASARWTVATTSILCSGGRLHHPPSGRSMPLGEITTAATKVPAPSNPPLRTDSAATRRSVPRWDIPDKTTGRAVFGIDVEVPNMLIAAVQCAPRRGARLLSFDRNTVLAQPGVQHAVPLPDGLAIVGTTYWQARRAFDHAGLQWSSEGSRLSSSGDGLPDIYATRLASGPLFTHFTQGEPRDGAVDLRPVEATYELPFQAHATMEPMNCTASMSSDRCDIWAPTQGVEMCQNAVAQLTGLPLERITIHRTLLGGGFGRRLLADFVLQAVRVSGAVGKPVKLIWSREEDMTHDFYRPAMLHHIAGAVDASGSIASLRHRVVSPSHMLYILPRGMFPGMTDWTAPAAAPEKIDTMAIEGLLGLPYTIPNQSVEQHRLELDVPVSVWRTTGHGPNNFVLESFVDELAWTAQKDPMAVRQALLAQRPRERRVLDELAARSQWHATLPSGRARGVAFAVAFGSLIGTVAEVSVADDRIRVHRVVTVVDCGRTLDPGIATSNILGGIVWGLSAMQTAITFDTGLPMQHNLNTFTPISLAQTPRCEVHFLESGAALGGTGELGAVPVPAAVCNGVFAATGRRIRMLPLSRSGLALA
jgi:isoquinoline 1-oxidoreductase beta subunit